MGLFLVLSLVFGPQLLDGRALLREGLDAIFGRAGLIVGRSLVEIGAMGEKDVFMLLLLLVLLLLVFFSSFFLLIFC